MAAKIDHLRDAIAVTIAVQSGSETRVVDEVRGLRFGQPNHS